jgi:hypothetical protein
VAKLIRSLKSRDLTIQVRHVLRENEPLRRGLIESAAKQARPLYRPVIEKYYDAMLADVPRRARDPSGDRPGAIPDDGGAQTATYVHGPSKDRVRVVLEKPWAPLSARYKKRKPGKSRGFFWYRGGGLSASLASVTSAWNRKTLTESLSRPRYIGEKQSEGVFLYAVKLGFSLAKLDPYVDDLLRLSFVNGERVPMSRAAPYLLGRKPGPVFRGGLGKLNFFEIPGRRKRLYRPLLGDIAAAYGVLLEQALKNVGKKV